MLCCYKNLLETSTVTLAAGTAEAAYPLYRLYDRDIGLIFKITAAATLEVHIDQGASGNLAADSLFIPAAHNLNGMTCDILYSDNNTVWYAAVTQWVQSGTAQIQKTWSSMTHRYWKFKVTSPASAPYFAELFLTNTYIWERMPTRPTGAFDPEFHIDTMTDDKGKAYDLIKGGPRRPRTYRMPNCNEVQKTNIMLLYAACGTYKPFWLYDHFGSWIYGKLRKNIGIKEISYQRYEFEFDFIEVLPE